MIFQNLLTQLAALFLGIITGIIVSWLAQEELVLYRQFIGNAARFTYMATLLLPLLFTHEFIIVGFIAGTYCIVGIWQQKEVQIFFCLAPLAALLCSTTSGFIIVLTAIFIATVFSTTILLTEYTKNQKIEWQKKMWIEGITVYGLYVVFSIIIYFFVTKNYFNF